MGQIIMPVIESKFAFLQMKMKPFCPHFTQFCQTGFRIRDLDTVRTESGFRINLTIYDTAGRLVRHLDLGPHKAGTYLQRDRAIYWVDRLNPESMWLAALTSIR
ncbi:uncharacterized protein METZ01_LOCUS258963 [marine metagenome]|uniref:Uncharacterized protein n=1 Tax=marine metagenome TaxID=408172 RepID=A0A382J3B7_9ZZZZ